MAIFYVDFENGNDANDGTTWALAWKTFTSGATVARIAPGDEIRVAKSADPTSLGQTALWSGIDRVYDTTQLTSSTNTSPIIMTSAGHGIVTGDIVQITSHTINTNANGKWIATRINDDSFSLDGSVGNGAGGKSGYFAKVNHRVVQLTNAVTKDVCNCDTAWTAGTGCTVTSEKTIVKEGLGSVKIVCGSSGANQILAKFALPSSLDLSDYQQLSFWLQNSAALAAGDMQIRLYSDTACTSLVETLSIDQCVAYGRLRPEVINKGSALSSTVQGIALYAVTSQAGKTHYLDNIIACKASSEPDSITLRSLISKNVENENGDHAFLGIQAIVGNCIFLDNVYNTYTYAGRGYSGVTENVTTYKREGIVLDAHSGVAQTLQDSGTAGNIISFIGGFNKVTDERDGYTVIDGLTGIRQGIYGWSKSYLGLSYFQATRFTYGFDYISYYAELHHLIATNNNSGGMRLYQGNFANLFILNNAAGLNTNDGLNTFGSMDGVTANNNMNVGIAFIAPTLTLIDNLIANNNKSYGVQFSNHNYVVGTIKSICFNSNSGLYFNTGTGRIVINRIIDVNFNLIGITFNSTYARIYLINNLNNNNTALSYSSSNNYIYKIEKANYSTLHLLDLGISNFNYIYEIQECIADTNTNFLTGVALEFYIYKGTFSGYSNAFSYNTVKTLYLIDCTFDKAELPATIIADSRVYQHNYNLSGHHFIATEFGYIEDNDTVRHTASGISWKIAITDARRTSEYPIKFSIAKIFCKGGSQAILSCWVKKTHATDIGTKLLIDHYPNTTVAEDTSIIAASTTNWQQLILYVTPTADGVVELTLETYWQENDADEFVYVDDVSAAQLI